MQYYQSFTWNRERQRDGPMESQTKTILTTHLYTAFIIRWILFSDGQFSILQKYIICSVHKICACVLSVPTQCDHPLTINVHKWLPSQNGTLEDSIPHFQPITELHNFAPWRCKEWASNWHKPNTTLNFVTPTVLKTE